MNRKNNLADILICKYGAMNTKPQNNPLNLPGEKKNKATKNKFKRAGSLTPQQSAFPTPLFCVEECLSQLVLAAAGRVAMMHKLLPQLVPALIRARSRAASWSLRRPDIWSGGLCTKSHQRQQPPGELFTFRASARGLGGGSQGFFFFFLSFFPVDIKDVRPNQPHEVPASAGLCGPL